jgi:hypothetical protein
MAIERQGCDIVIVSDNTLLFTRGVESIEFLKLAEINVTVMIIDHQVDRQTIEVFSLLLILTTADTAR